MKIAIIEDEQVHTDLLAAYIQSWSKEKKIPINVHSFPSAENFLFTWEETKDFDILFVDIQMREMNGVEMAKRVREDGEEIAIVFTTGIADYMETGYDVEALHYLLKPIDPEKIGQCMEKALYRRQKEEFILVHGKEETVRIPVKRINYIEAQGHGCVIETSSKTGDTVRTGVSESISYMEKQLEPFGFIKCHRSYLCRIGSIYRIGREEIFFDNGSRIPVSRRMYKKTNQAFIQCFRNF